MNIINEFPLMTEAEIINNVTLGNKSLSEPMKKLSKLLIHTGVFQLKRARSYAEERASTTDFSGPVSYDIQQCRDFPDIIRVPTRSAHVNRTTYHPTIRFDANDILDWWCDCPSGSRFVGCCSHVASIIWFLAFARWQNQSNRMPSTEYVHLFQDAAAPLDMSDTDDDDSTDENSD